MQNTPQLLTTSITHIGMLCRTRHIKNTIGIFVIRNAKKLPGFLQFSLKKFKWLTVRQVYASLQKE